MFKEYKYTSPQEHEHTYESLKNTFGDNNSMVRLTDYLATVEQLEQKIEFMNQNCISSGLHESRMRNLEATLSAKDAEIKELENKLLYHDKIVEHNIDLSTKINGLEYENDNLKIKLRICNDRSLRAYDGLTDKADKADALEAEIAALKAKLERIDKAYSMRASDVYLTHNMNPHDYLCKEISEAIYGDTELDQTIEVDKKVEGE
jgi:predicted RNase H-like nuclease (RuvC/YqgF family)